MQLISFLPITNVNFPKNAHIFFLTIYNTYNFNFFPDQYEKMINLDLSEGPYPNNDRVVEMGYESTNITQNIGSDLI